MRFPRPPALATSVLGPSVRARAEGFDLKDGDAAVFLGEGIAAARATGKIIESSTFPRFPNRKIRFIAAKIGGGPTAGGLKRLGRGVFARGHRPDGRLRDQRHLGAVRTR